MLDPAVWHSEPDLVVVGFIRLTRTVDLRGEDGAIVRIDPADDPPQGHRSAAVEPEDAIELFGESDLVGVQVPGKAARLAESLGMGKLRLATPGLQHGIADSLDLSSLVLRSRGGVAG